MGRKIPGKKHRSIVDPEKQRAKRIESLKNKINNPPQNPDEQEVPRSVLTIMKLKKQTQENDKVKRKLKKRKRRRKKYLTVERFLDKDIIQPGMKEPEKFIPNLVQHPNETPESFYHRVNSMTQKCCTHYSVVATNDICKIKAFTSLIFNLETFQLGRLNVSIMSQCMKIIQESKFEDKFDVTIKKDAKTGKVLKVEKNKKIKSSKNESKKKTLSQKRKEKIKNKASKNDGKDFSQLKDVVEFGEVTHRPPNKLNLQKKLKAHTVKKKDKYKDLLLQSVFKSCNDQQQQVGQK